MIFKCVLFLEMFYWIHAILRHLFGLDIIIFTNGSQQCDFGFETGSKYLREVGLESMPTRHAIVKCGP